MSTNAGMRQGLSDIGQVLNRLIDVQRALSEDVLKLVGSGGEAFGGVLRDTLNPLGSPSCCVMPKFAVPQLTASCCDIPQPCWMPLCLGEFACRVCAGSATTVRLRVINEDIRPHTIIAMASGAAAEQVSFAPSGLPLGPKERGSIVATLSIPATAKDGEEFEAIVWLRGCRDYYLRWTVKVVSRSGCCAHEVSVCDGPDNFLHWYDHFYCPRPCHDGLQD